MFCTDTVGGQNANPGRVHMQTEDSLAALFEGLKSMYPGFKHEPIFMGIDEIDEGSLGDPYRMAKGKVTVCQKIVALAEQHDVAAICCATASPSAVKLINLRKFEQVGLGLIVPKRLWQQELAPGHSYAGHQAYCGPRGDPANNIIPSSDCPGHAISKQVCNDCKSASAMQLRMSAMFSCRCQILFPKSEGA